MSDTDRTELDELLVETNAILARLELGVIVLDSLLGKKEVFLLEAGKTVDALRADAIEHTITTA